MQSLNAVKREPKRSRVFLDALVRSGGAPAAARIRDISRTGALVESDFAQEAGASVRLSCGDIHVDARVAWADEGCFGLEFDTPLLIGKLVDQSGSGLNVSAPRSYRRSDLD